MSRPPRDPRTAIEDALTSEGLRILHRRCAIVGIEPHRWRRVSWIRIATEVEAVEALAAALEETDAPYDAYDPAMREACARLGLSSETHRKRLNRALADSFNPNKAPADIMSLPA